MGVTIGVRLISNMALFVLLARLWGGDRFGSFMYPYVLATIFSVLIDYGLSLRVVRDIAADASRAPVLVSRAFWTKVCIALVLLLPVGASSLMSAQALVEQGLLFVLLAGATVQSLAQVSLCALRGVGEFQAEARITLFGSALHAGLAGAVALMGAGPVGVATVMLAARVGLLAYAAKFVSLRFPQLRLRKVSLSDIRSELSHGFPFAAHALLGALYFQIDNVLIRHLLGITEVGWYQAGMRVIMGSLLFSEVLGNVYLVSLSSETSPLSGDSRFATVYHRMTRHFAFTGLVGAALLVSFAGWITRVLYGPEFSIVAELLPGLGCVMLVRYLILPYAITLTACGAQSTRAVGAGIAVLVSVLANLWLIPEHGLFGAVIASGVTHVILGAFFVWSVARRDERLVPDVRAVILTGLSILLILANLSTVDPSTKLLGSAALVVMGCLVGITSSDVSSLMMRFGSRGASAS